MKHNISEQTQQEALKISKATARPGQTKEQTKLIAKGVEKALAEYKKQQKVKAREKDKAKKKTTHVEVPVQPTSTEKPKNNSALIAWSLLAISWVGFISFIVYSQYV